MSAVDRLLDRARARLVRVSPEQAHAAFHDGAILVDTRPDFQRDADGAIPGALVIERNHLEWRLDPEGTARVPEAAGWDVRVVVFCDEGYASSLAAASLVDLGLSGATDLIGGFQAWKAAGLPVVPSAGRGRRTSAAASTTSSATP
ncbi:sulfurtransferase [Embleya scabrispora]|uniref:Sulfurtransferase n=1 Tax=Embleya scabrispora TaxID=159449 RepID=A0A1T3P135_9ACTN|nr:rhodanese-like domain-containing protein [Embleya scabrispora]OPC82704.1 sulfurtransferase [Embleya scabrispora]